MSSWLTLAAVLAALAVLLAMRGVRAEECGARPGRPASGSDMQSLERLRKDVICPYDRNAGPTRESSNKTKVTVRFARSRMDVNEEDNTLTLFGYILLQWTDKWLIWEPSKYGNVSRLYVDWEEIWTPSIVMIESPTKVLKASQALIINGTVVWTLLVPVKAPCLSDPYRWPYDMMTCNITLGNLSPDTAQLVTTQVQLNLLRYRNKGWRVTQLRMVPFSAAGFSDGILVQATVKRNSAKFEATVVLPCVVLGLLVLAAPWLPADAPHRPLLLCTVILAQVMMNVVVPTRVRVVGAEAPAVMLLLRDALLLSGAALLQWLLAGWLLGLPSTSGKRIAAVLCLPSSPTPGGLRLANLADRASFAVLVVVFAGLTLRLVPTQD